MENQNEIIEKNLEKMLSLDEGGMIKLLFGESIGGNAGYNCAGANFYYKKNSGEIVYFENYQFLPKEILEDYKNGILEHGIFKVAVDLSRLPNKSKRERNLEEEKHIFFKIVKFYGPDNNIEKIALDNIIESIKAYNRKMENR